MHLQKARRYHEHAPGSAIAKDTANFALIFEGATTNLTAEFAGKRSQTFISNFEANFRHSTLRGKHLLGTIHAKPSQELVGSFAKRGTEKPVEMKFGKAGFASRLLEQNA
jgi:hypothetical protein